MAEFLGAHLGGGYSSELDDETNSVSSKGGGFKFKTPAPVTNQKEKEWRKTYGSSLLNLNAYERHKRFISEYVLRYNPNIADHLPSNSHHRTDQDVLKEHYQFIREGDEDSSKWEVRMAVKYYNKLFKEYCLADMSRYKEGKVGLRWRTQAEVFSGKGQFVCGNKKCNEKEELKSYEVNFAYLEHGEKKNALVKLRLCTDCAYKLNYKHIKKEKKEKKKAEKRESKRRRLEEGPPQDTPSGEEQPPQTINPKSEQGIPEPAPEEGSKEPQPTSQQASHNQPLVPPKGDNDAWRQAPTLEKTRDEEFDEYFDGMFL